MLKLIQRIQTFVFFTVGVEKVITGKIFQKNLSVLLLTFQDLENQSHLSEVDHLSFMQII